MGNYSWIAGQARAEGFIISPKLRRLLNAEPVGISPFEFKPEKYAMLHLKAFQEQFPTLICVPFARRCDCDNLFVIVLQDAVYKRGQVIPVDIEDVTHYCLGEPYPSLDAWADDVWTQLEEWHKFDRIRHTRVEQMFLREGFMLSRDLRWILACDRVGLRDYFLLDEDGGAAWRASIQKHIPDVNFMLFAGRRSDLVIGVVLDDPVYQRGQILVVVHNATTTPYIDYAYPTVAAWARDARKDIMRHRFLSRCGRFARLASWAFQRLSRPLAT